MEEHFCLENKNFWGRKFLLSSEGEKEQSLCRFFSLVS